MASPEQALVPLKERDALLASKNEVRGPLAQQLRSLLQQPGVSTSSTPGHERDDGSGNMQLLQSMTRAQESDAVARAAIGCFLSHCVL
jgi:hypothetical protein